MKKLLLTLFSFIVLILNVSSQTATVTVFSQDGEKFWVILNGIRQNDSPSTNVKVTGLSSPNYRLKIIFEDEKSNTIDKDIMTHDVDNVLCDQSYVLKKDKNGRYVMRLNMFEPAKTIAATVEPNQTAVPFTSVEKTDNPVEALQKQPTQVKETTTVTTTNSNNNSNVGVNIKDPETGEVINMDMNISETGVGVNIKDPMGENINMNVGIKENTSTQTSVTTTTTTTTTITGREERDDRPVPPIPKEQPPYQIPGYNGPNGCDYPMSPQDFNDAKTTIASKSFEDSKLTIAKQITSSNCLLTAQVKEIMMLFSFEDSKLQFAKYAYKYTFDIGNYFKINDAFTFEMSINDLNEYIASQKK